MFVYIQAIGPVSVCLALTPFHPDASLDIAIKIGLTLALTNHRPSLHTAIIILKTDDHLHCRATEQSIESSVVPSRSSSTSTSTTTTTTTTTTTPSTTTSSTTTTTTRRPTTPEPPRPFLQILPIQSAASTQQKPAKAKTSKINGE